MNSITVTVPVTVKAKLTEKLKARLLDEMSKAIEQLDLEIKQIDLDRQRELNKNPQHINEINNYFGNEIAQRQERLDDISHRREDMTKLSIGAEITQGTLERQVEIKVGDDMRELMNVEVLVEDDKIIAIRG